jgi:hypothetical protein
MRSIFVTLVILSAALLTGREPARADTNYPWCALYYNGDGVTTCAYETEAQCKMTVSGIGGACQKNPGYNPSLPMDPLAAQQPPTPQPPPPAPAPAAAKSRH